MSGPRRGKKEDTLMDDDVTTRTASIIEGYASSKPDVTAKALQKYWLEFEANRGIELI